MARPQADQALVASQSSPQAVSTEGFDPSRWRADSYEGKPRHLPKKERQELDKLLRAARAHIKGLTPYRKELLFKAAQSVSPINCGWQQYALADAFIFELHAIATEARRAETSGSVEDEGAGPKDIAQS